MFCWEYSSRRCFLNIPRAEGKPRLPSVKDQHAHRRAVLLFPNPIFFLLHLEGKKEQALEAWVSGCISAKCSCTAALSVALTAQDRENTRNLLKVMFWMELTNQWNHVHMKALCWCFQVLQFHPDLTTFSLCNFDRNNRSQFELHEKERI